MENTNLGNYRILEQIGEGGMGTVYRARDLTLEREVAIKIISPELARNPNLMARFRVEAIAQARLNHSNIVTIHAFSQQEEMYYIVMEYISGQTLKTILKDKCKIPVYQALVIAAGVLEGLAYAHSRGVLHRDIKPANIFVKDNDTIKLGDFGIAKVQGIDGLTRVGSTIGTLYYSSPEQLRGEKMGPSTDIYSVGVTLYEMLTGKLPFTSSSGSNYEIQIGHLEKIPQLPSTLNNTIPNSVDNLIMKSLAKSAGQRFSDAGEFKRTIEKLLDENTGKHKSPKKIKYGKAGPLPDWKQLKLNFPKIKQAATSSSIMKGIKRGVFELKSNWQSLKIAIKSSPLTPVKQIVQTGKGMEKKNLLIILITLVVLLFIIVVVAFAETQPQKDYSLNRYGRKSIWIKHEVAQ